MPMPKSQDGGTSEMDFKSGGGKKVLIQPVFVCLCVLLRRADHSETDPDSRIAFYLLFSASCSYI